MKHAHQPDIEQAVASRTRRKIRARREGDQSVWFGLGMFGLVGWAVTIPTLFGAAIGVWIDSRWPGPHSWTLMLLILGVFLGCLNAWTWMQRESSDLRSEVRTGENDDLANQAEMLSTADATEDADE